MSISILEIQKIARLSNLNFEPEELERFAGQFAQILDYIAQLSAVDTDGVEPTFHTLPDVEQGTPTRPDETLPSFEPEQALSNAPSSSNGLFKVPRVID